MRKGMRKRILSLMLCVLMVIGLMPVMPEVVKAENTSNGAVSYISYSWNEESKTLSRSENSVTEYTEVTVNDTTWGTENKITWYVVSESIVISSRVSVIGDVHLILKDGVEFSVFGGIGLADRDSHITIYGQNKDTGIMTIDVADDNQAGIGANDYENCGNITIYGGTIVATGGENGAGIGSGLSSCNGAITIYGGDISATGGENGAGIGSGSLSGSEAITIYGGTITATGGDKAAGIGSGCGGGCGNITIYGGVINASRGIDADGIGKGISAYSSITFTLNGDAQVYTSSINVNTKILSAGILFEGDNGTVYGNVTISEDFKIDAGKSLTIPANASLIIEADVDFTNKGTITNSGTITNTGKVVNSGNGQIENSNSGSIDCQKHYCVNCEESCHLCDETISHELEYTVDGNSIIANCTSIAENCDARGAKVTLTAEPVVYSGYPCEALITKDDGFPVQITGNDIKYKDSEGNELDGAPVNAGTYTASITVGEKTIKVEYTIRKANLTITNVTVTDKDYDGKDTIAITAVTVDGKKSSDDVNVDVSKLTGKLSSVNAGTYDKITVEGLDAIGVLTGDAANNYTLTQSENGVSLTTPVEIYRVSAPYHQIIKRYVYTVDTAESIDLTEFLPDDYGSLSGASMPTVSGEITYTSDGVKIDMGNERLSYTVCKGNIGDTGEIRVSLISQNYYPVDVTIVVELIDKHEVLALDDVTLKSNSLIMGESLSKLEFNEVKFSADGKEIEGTLAWKDASIVPTVDTTSATWVFTPKDTDRYQVLTGTTFIWVEEAPHIQGADGKQGWDVVLDAVADAKEGDTVKVDMNGTTVVLGDVIEDIKGKNITIEFDMGNGIVWSVNGKDVTAETIADINMAVSVSTPEFPFNMIPVEVLNMVTGENYHVEINLAHNGEFGFTAVLSINLEAKNAGLFANLFYYNPTKQEMEFICADEIAADGSADLKFTHASDYTIVIDDVAGDAVVPDVPNVPDVPANPTSPKTGEGVGFACGMMLLVLACGSVMVMRKRKNMK